MNEEKTTVPPDAPEARPVDATTQSERDAGLVAVYAAPNEVMAQMVRATLEAEGIPAVIGERVTEAYAPLLQTAEGLWGEVCVPEEWETHAREVLSRFEEGEGRISDEDLTEAALRMPPPE